MILDEAFENLREQWGRVVDNNTSKKEFDLVHGGVGPVKQTLMMDRTSKDSEKGCTTEHF